MRRLRPDTGQPEHLRDLGDDGHSAVGGEGHHAASTVTAPNLGDGLDVSEVDDLADIGDGKAGRGIVAVDGDHAGAKLSNALERASLVASGPDEQHSLHGDQLMASTL